MHWTMWNIVIVQVFLFLRFLVLAEGQSISPVAQECVNRATCPCCNVPCPSSGSGYCGDVCKDGYHGPRCADRCPFKCISCKNAIGLNYTANCTRCNDGYYSTQTLYQCQLSCSPLGCQLCMSSTFCTSCLDGYYLTDTNRCEHCNDTCFTCNSTATCRSCKAGYYLDEADGNCYKCGPLCYTCSSNISCVCPNGCSDDLCQWNSSACLFGCKKNFVYGPTGTCESCIDGWYGYQCNQTCSENCSSVCDRVTGVCAACRSGLFGDYCDRTCPQHCSSTCNDADSNCDGCKHGFYGNHCNLECPRYCQDCRQVDGVCTECLDGFYGEVCERNCSQHCVINKCQQTDGTCECAAGYVGGRCQNAVSATAGGSTTDKPLLIVTPTPRNIVLPSVGGTLGSVVVIAAFIVLICICKRRGHCCKDNIPRVTLKDSTVHEARIKAELASIEAEVTSIHQRENDAKARRLKLESDLRHLEQHMPYSHTERADVVQSVSSYEQLGRKSQTAENPYATIVGADILPDSSYEQLARRSVRGESPYIKMDDVSGKEQRVTYEVLQMERGDTNTYSSLKS